MKDIKEIVEALKDAKPGTVVEVKGYINSKEEKSDLTVEILGPEGYKDLKKEDLEILENFKVASLENKVDVAIEALQKAHEALLASCRSSIAGDGQYRGPNYEYVGEGNMAVIKGDEGGAYYLTRLKLVSDLTPGIPRKSEDARAKQVLSDALQLPSLRYVHVLKFAPGKFEEVTLKKG